MITPSIIKAQKNNERTLIEAVLSSFYIIDYGFIEKVNADDTINVTHAKQLVSLAGETLPATETKNIEVLTLSAASFSFKYELKKGDKVLLLGLKNFVKKAEDVTASSVDNVYLHYTQETIKALPLCVFNEGAKITLEVKEGKFSLVASDTIELDGSDFGGLCKTPELKTQLGYLTARVDTIINALINSPTAAQDGGAAYKAAITTALNAIANKEDFSEIENEKVKHGKGE